MGTDRSRKKIIHARKTFRILGAPEAEDGMENWEANWNRDALERIVALLFALAGLADLAAGLPFHRRRQVLGILSWGEAEARAFVIGTDVPDPGDAPPDDAACLAVRLRALALMLCVFLAQRVERPGTTGPRRGRKLAGTIVRLATAAAFDTS